MALNKDEDLMNAIEICKAAQSTIDFEALYLQGLRRQCSQTSEFTQREIRESESKLVKLFSKQLVSKAACKGKPLPECLEKYPSTTQWLELVGLPSATINDMINKSVKLDNLLEMSEDQMEAVISKFVISEEDSRKLVTALIKMKLWTDRQLRGDPCNGKCEELHWTPKSTSVSVYSVYSGQNSPYPGNRGPSTSSLPPNTTFNAAGGFESPDNKRSHPPSPMAGTLERRRPGASTPPVQHPNKFNRICTPPPNRKNQLVFQQFPKSISDEFGHKTILDSSEKKHKKKSNKPNNINIAGNQHVRRHDVSPGRRRPSTESSDPSGGSQGPSTHTSPVVSPSYKQNGDDQNKLSLPKSPNPRTMMHAIQHRFTSKIVFGDCDSCHKTVFRGKVCKHCKLKFHKDCAETAPPDCGLPPAMLEEFIDSMRNSPNIPTKSDHTTLASSNGHDVPAFSQHFDSSSVTSSCSSSTPSSPANMNLRQGTGHHHTSNYTGLLYNGSQFDFPDGLAIILDQKHLDFVNTNVSNDSDKTMIDSNSSEKTLPDRGDSIDSQFDEDYPINRQSSLSVALKEWDIPYENLVFLDKIGDGRFGTVYKGNWHGEVAIKTLNTDTNTDNQAQLKAFKLEVAMLRRTRHDNLVLFMGACMKPPHLCLVSSLCKGSTLFTSIHMRKEKFNMNRIVIIASQICQAMGYLHDRQIIHKDLMSKNVFLENGKVVITDFGLFNFTKLCRGNRKGDWLTIPSGWLCYLAPQVIMELQAGYKDPSTSLPFSNETDVYAFGTVWYELLCGEYPFRHQPPEAIIWQVGTGIKQSLNSIQASRDVKELLTKCWSFSPTKRPSFSNILQMLEKLPKKRLNRCPSHPVQLSRSAESIY